MINVFLVQLITVLSQTFYEMNEYDLELGRIPYALDRPINNECYPHTALVVVNVCVSFIGICIGISALWVTLKNKDFM